MNKLARDLCSAVDAADLRHRYRKGERNFSGACLNNAELRGAELSSAKLRNGELIEANLSNADLSGADLRLAKLRSANLSDVNLRNADLQGADLRVAKLCNANLEDANLSAADLRGADLGEASLIDGNLEGANLRAANLAGADFSRAILRSADLSDTILTDADLRDTKVGGANLRGASLRGADFSNADLCGADLRNADFYGVDLAGAQLGGAMLDRATLSHMVFDNVDLAAFLDARDVRHLSPSSVGVRSVMRSYRHAGLRRFMVDCGVPPLFADYMIDCARSLGEGNIRAMLQSTFISYGGPDEPFARKLYEALKARGVVTFFFPEDAKVGERLHRVMYHGVNEHDRVLLVCSMSSLTRRGVVNEIEETFAREARDGGATYLLPIRLDDYVINNWKTVNPVLADRVLDRVIADFRGADTDNVKFAAALDRVVDALKVKPVPSSA